MKIIEIQPDASESKDHIITAYIKVVVNNLEVWAFVMDWSFYFPYYPKPSEWGIGEKLFFTLKNCPIKLSFKLLNITSINF